jgi:hypothetical protein
MSKFLPLQKMQSLAIQILTFKDNTFEKKNCFVALIFSNYFCQLQTFRVYFPLRTPIIIASFMQATKDLSLNVLVLRLSRLWDQGRLKLEWRALMYIFHYFSVHWKSILGMEKQHYKKVVVHPALKKIQLPKLMQIRTKLLIE